MKSYFKNRFVAGRQLAAILWSYLDESNYIFLALPRGGVPVAFEVAKELNTPFDILIVRKLGVPGHEELAMGAISDDFIPIMNENILHSITISHSAIDAVINQEKSEIIRRTHLYRQKNAPIDVSGKCVVIIDDGLATGSTMTAAVIAIRARKPSRIIVAVPVAPKDTIEQLKHIADEVIAVLIPKRFFGVGQFYTHFPQLSDDEVLRILKESSVFFNKHHVANVLH